MSDKENKSGRPKKALSPFNEIFRDMVGSATQQEIAEKIGVSRQNVGRWISGDTAPDINTLCKIADAYNVSTEYLLGRTPHKTSDANLKAVCDYTGLSEKAVNQIIKSGKNCNTTLNDICESLQFWFVVQSLANFATAHRVITEYSNNKSFSLPENEKELTVLDNLTMRKAVEELHATKCFNYLVDYVEQLAGERGSKESEDKDNG